MALDQVTSEQRRYAKVINFGLIYGMSSFGLAKNLGIETKAAAAYIDRYFQRYPGVKQYMDETKAQAKARGRGNGVRPPPVPAEINSPTVRAAAGAERAAINAPCRARRPTSSSWPWWRCSKELDAHKPTIKMIMQVHDELVFELPEAEVDWLKAAIPKLMADVAELKVPLLAEVGVGPTGTRRIEDGRQPTVWPPCCKWSVLRLGSFFRCFWLLRSCKQALSAIKGLI